MDTLKLKPPNFLNMKNSAKKQRPGIAPMGYKDLKALRSATGLYHPYDFVEYLEKRLIKLKPATVEAIAKYHHMKGPVSDPEMVALWMAETIFEQTAWPN